MATAPPAAETAPAEPRDRLLAAVVAHAEQHGIADASLREIAAAVGSSHRMLIYHFGSREGLLVAVTQAVEDAQRDFLSSLADDPTNGPVEATRAMWRRFADPQWWPQERLFFELYGQALQGRPGTERFLDGVIDSWIATADVAAAQLGMDVEAARVDTRLGIAVMRGLLLDLLATGDRRAVDEAFERFVGFYAS